MIHRVSPWTDPDGNSLFEEGSLQTKKDERGDFIDRRIAVKELSFPETRSGGFFEWRKNPVPRHIPTFGGTLEFETISGPTVAIRPARAATAPRIESV